MPACSRLRGKLCLVGHRFRLTRESRMVRLTCTSALVSAPGRVVPAESGSFPGASFPSGPATTGLCARSHTQIRRQTSRSPTPASVGNKAKPKPSPGYQTASFVIRPSLGRLLEEASNVGPKMRATSRFVRGPDSGPRRTLLPDVSVRPAGGAYATGVSVGRPISASVWVGLAKTSVRPMEAGRSVSSTGPVAGACPWVGAQAAES
jgi:hypothetical protein